jgi:hypothetical protein
MKGNTSEFFRSAYIHLEPNEILRASTAALLGVSQAAEQALSAIGINTIFDLGAAWVFTNARSASEAGKMGGLTARLGIAPSDLLKSHASWSALEEIGNLDLKYLRGIDDIQADQLKLALHITTIRDFGFYPPHLIARGIVGKANGSTIDQFEAQETEELRPRFGEYPTERVYYSTLVMLQMQQSGERQNLDGPVSLKSAVANKTGFNKIAVGAQLTFSQSWYAQGITLGHMLHSLALAPGEATRIAVVDWSRRTRASSTESISESEQLDSATSHARAISEVQEAVAGEFQQGGSTSQSSSNSSSSSFSAAGGTGLFSAFVDINISGGGQSANTRAQASSNGWSLGTRSVNSQMAQDVNDRTEQHSTSVRNRRATAVREVSQSEHEKVSTRIVANYNHMHALTIQYYEVVQIYRVAAQLHRADRCLFIPLELFTFEGSDALDIVGRFRGALINVALTKRIRSLLIDDTTAVEVKPVLDVKVPSIIPDLTPIFELESTNSLITATAFLKREKMEKIDPEIAAATEILKANVAKNMATLSSVKPSYAWKSRDIAHISNLISRPILRPDSDNLFFPDDAEIVGISFEDIQVKSIRLDRSGLDTPDNTFAIPIDSARLDISQGIRLIDVEAIYLAKANESSSSGKMIIQASYFGRRFNLPAIPVVLSPGMQMQKVATFESDQADRQRELLSHLKANHVYYSQAIFRALDTPTIVMILSQYNWNGRPLSDQVEPKPISVTGNYLVLRAPVENQDFSGVVIDQEEPMSWEKLLETRGIKLGESNGRLIPIPTTGVFAEAVLGRSNSAEKLDITRYWNWQDSPIPLQPTEIAPISMGSRGQAEDLKPGQLGQPVLNIVNPTALPEPAGLGAVLNAVANGKMFNDMSGLSGTQGLVQSGMAGTLQAATDAGLLASENMRTSAQKAVSMAQITADLAKSIIGAATGAPMSGGSGTVQGISGDGAKINHAKNLDDRGVKNNTSSSGSSQNNNSANGNNGSRNPSTSSDGNLNALPFSNTESSGFEADAFNKTNWGNLGTSGNNLFESASSKNSLIDNPNAIASNDPNFIPEASSTFLEFYKKYLDQQYPSKAPLEDSPYTKNRDYYTLQAYSKAFGQKDSSWDPLLGFKPNEGIIRKLYDYYQKTYQARPEQFMWAGLGRLAGGAVLGGLLTPALPDPSFLTDTLVLIGKAIFLDLAWQHELFLVDPQKTIDMAREHDKKFPAKTQYEVAWKKISSGTANEIIEGNRMLLENEQFTIIQPLYDAIKQSSDSFYFSKTNAFTPNIHPYHLPFIESFPSGQNRDVTIANDRWEWITKQDGMWDKWVRIPVKERTRLVNLPMNQLLRKEWGPVQGEFLPPGR